MEKPIITTAPNEDYLLQRLKKQQEAVAYLNACLDDEDPRVFLLGLRQVAEAHGGVGAISRQAKLNRESLYRMLSKSGNPSLKSLAAVLGACGLRLSVQSTAPKRKKRKAA